MAAEASKRGFRPDQIHVANYGIDRTEVARGIARGATAWSDHCDALFIGQFRAQKGLDDLITIWRRVQERLPSARLAVIGDGSGLTADRFKDQTKQFNNQTVSLLGVISGPDKYAALSGSKIFLFPSHHESWGLVALEAMAAGVPVIGYDIPSSREAFGDAMLSVPAYDIDAFANAVVRCLTNPATRETYRQRGLQRASRYDWDTIATNFAKSVLN
jgi:glycosyltransferase involved in cell wall biosynthesis